MHDILLSVLSLFKFQFDAPPIQISVDFIKSWAAASIPGFFVCMCCAAMKHCLASNVLGISSRIQLLLPPAYAASMLFIGDTVISGICVALVALCIVVPRGKNRFFNYAFLWYTVSLAVIIIIMNWFQSTQGGGQPALQYVASSVISFVAVHCVCNVEVKQPMSQVWDSNMYGTKLKFHEWFLNTANEDGDGAEDDGTFAPEDGDRGEDGDEGEDGDGGEDDGRFASEDYGDEIVSCARGVQLLAIRANFRIHAIVAFDWHDSKKIYMALEGEVQEEGKDFVLTGPYSMIEAYCAFGLKVFTADNEGSCTGHFSHFSDSWDVAGPDEVEEFTETMYGGHGRELEVTYLVIPEAVETHFEVRLNLKDLGSRSRAVYGSIKAIAIDYGSKSVHLFSCERGRSLPLPCGSTCILPLEPHMIALPYGRHRKLHVEVDLRVITTCGQEEDKNLKFCLDCSRRIMSEESLDYRHQIKIRSQKRDFDGDQVEIDVIWHRTAG